MTPAPSLGGLAHLPSRLGQVHQPRAHGGHGDLGDREHGPVAEVETLRDVASELDVLALVVPDRDVRRPVQQDVRGHQHGVGEEGGAGHRLPPSLLLELDHPVQLADERRALEQVSETRVRGHPALLEQGRPCGIEAAGEHQRAELGGERAEGRRVVRRRHRVQVGDAVEAGRVVLMP